MFKLSGFKWVGVCLFFICNPSHTGSVRSRWRPVVLSLWFTYTFSSLSGSRGLFQTQWLNGKSVRFTPNPTLPPQRYISKVSSRCHCVIHGKVMKQVNATYKPGDRPDSIYATAEGCSAKCLRALVCSIFYCPPLLLRNLYARAAQRTQCKKL